MNLIEIGQRNFLQKQQILIQDFFLTWKADIIAVIEMMKVELPVKSKIKITTGHRQHECIDNPIVTVNATYLEYVPMQLRNIMSDDDIKRFMKQFNTYKNGDGVYNVTEAVKDIFDNVDTYLFRKIEQELLLLSLDYKSNRKIDNKVVCKGSALLNSLRNVFDIFNVSFEPQVKEFKNGNIHIMLNDDEALFINNIMRKIRLVLGE